MAASPDERLSSQWNAAVEAGAAVALEAATASPEQPIGIVILPTSAAAMRSDATLRRVVAELQGRGFATILAELLLPAEAGHGYHSFDIDLLARRIADVAARLRRDCAYEGLPVGYFGMSVDAAAIAIAVAVGNCPAHAIVMCNARPELAHGALPSLQAPTLLIVDRDQPLLDLNRNALTRLGGPGDIALVENGGRVDSPATAARIARLAADWFATHLRSRDDAAAP